ncbi:hypothetical protein JOC95_000270 [Bacillus tianshenii]|uniref:Uncharacterized protein n=1 Tax=Sutcliffiella tianshenii TaxID=1463404 RepID=A0ABS2NV65_9BACI|nr:hypothetical protein [Bacillus tianshenii]MBM7618428.1 hypothetical protein [Bacillus tianshenii]
MTLYFEWIKNSGGQDKGKERFNFVQTNETMEVTHDSLVEILKLDVTILSPMEKVCLDSKIGLKVETGAPSEYSIHSQVSLWRNSTLLTSETIASTNQLGREGKIKTFMNSISLSWTDVLLAPGKYTYTVKAGRMNDEEKNISTVQVQDRVLNALVLQP